MPKCPFFAARISDSDVRVQYILGDINIKEADGSSISEMPIGKRMSLELNQNMRGRNYIVIPGDGSTEWMMNLGNQLPFSAFTSGIENASIRDVFVGYLRDDIQLALDGQRRRKINNIGNKGFDLRFFKELLPADLVNQIDTLIKSKDKDKMTKLEELVTQSANIVTQSVNNLINEEVENTKNLLVLNQEITMNSDGNYKFSGIEDNISDMYGLNKNNMTEEELTTFLRFLRTNFIINNIEYHKVLFGDPAIIFTGGYAGFEWKMSVALRLGLVVWLGLSLLLLDVLDGYLARKLGHVTTFGTLFELSIDLLTHTFVWTLSGLAIAPLFIALEWMAGLYVAAFTMQPTESWKNTLIRKGPWLMRVHWRRTRHNLLSIYSNIAHFVFPISLFVFGTTWVGVITLPGLIMFEVVTIYMIYVFMKLLISEGQAH